ncbi:pancreatic lipase-related protein 2-like [Centruroides sculpturatus]|uniref:pancreatic lipase-related protein 2-like n=1 Tax=Centruroides sculpturatus TaxID=218467 RepID=UPI000C6EA521|nr:pancreatic lipase-related protein 2-like [Centruroides sculpturatus]
MEKLGCFSNGPPFFHAVHRPTSFLPVDRALIRTKFLLYTGQNPKRAQVLKAERPETIERSNFDGNRPTKFIVHGFMYSAFTTSWMRRVKDALLSVGDFNVILVDWIFGSLISYRLSAANARVVGAEIAFLIRILQNITRIRPQSIHIIGHSQGAHIAGYAGKRIKYLGRITGLDAAGPYFRHAPSPVRLDAKDALLVDNIHTNAGSNVFQGIGTNEVLGHLDFFPNGGNYNPSCKVFPEKIYIRTFFELFLSTFFCNHFASFEFYIESIIKYPDCFVGVPCSSYPDFSAGKCICTEENPCSVMGFHVDKYEHLSHKAFQIFYLKTGSEKPYCLHQYQILIELGGDAGGRSRGGKLLLVLRDTTDNFETITLINKDGIFRTDVMYSFLVTNNRRLNVKDVWLKWQNAFQILRQKRFLNVKYFRITPITVYTHRMKTEMWCGTCPSSLTLNKWVPMWKLKCQNG